MHRPFYRPGIARSPVLSWKKRTVPVLLGSGLILLFAEPAHAYLDPGTGSYFFQMMIAAVVGGLFAVKMFWRRLKAFFTRKRSVSAGEEEPGEHEDSGTQVP